MKILHRYVLKEHAGPLAFSLGALTSLLLLNYVAKRFGELAGKGLPWSVIAEFFALAIPFIVAMTLPMAVLVATLYAFSRLAAENEITALKASGVGMRRVLTPVLWAAAGVTVIMILFNDQVLPRSNHKLSVLQRDIAQKKPTFALREQIINELSPGKLYLRAGHLDENSNRMREITIYDFSDPGRRRTIFADSGNLAMSQDLADLIITLHSGTMQDVTTAKPSELQRLAFVNDYVRVRGVGNQFRKSDESGFKGEREMTVCEMAGAYANARKQYIAEQREFRERLAAARRARVALSAAVRQTRVSPPSGKSLGESYCAAVGAIGASISRANRALERTTRPTPAGAQTGGRSGVPVSTPSPTFERGAATGSAHGVMPGRPRSTALTMAERAILPALLETSRIRLIDARANMSLYGVEIHKKFALAVACMVFVLLGAPIALRFPRGGVGLVIGVSIGVFGLYYVALIGGQALGSRGLVPPALAMWAANALFGGVAALLLARMGRASATTHGGDTRELIETVGSWTARQLAYVGLRMGRRGRYP